MAEQKSWSSYEFCWKFKNYKKTYNKTEDCLKFSCDPVCEINLLLNSFELTAVNETNERECLSELFIFYEDFSKGGRLYSKHMFKLQNCLRKNN